MSYAADAARLLDAPLGAQRREITVDATTGRPRQAGADAEGETLTEYRIACERSLFAFAKGILGRGYLTRSLHRPVCQWLETCPPRRKLLLLPRGHCKTTLVSHALPLHILMQPKDANLYLPGQEGTDQRILLAGETETRASDHLRVIQTQLESNTLLRGFWPQHVWKNARKEARKWNDRELILPRRQEYPDPSIRAIGVGGAITGAHPSVIVKDDLISVEAANSPVVMQIAIQWHTASRALIDRAESLEFVIGTRWSVEDLYAQIIRSDPTVEVLTRAVVEDGVPIYPEHFSLERIDQLQREFGVLFPLLYMNSAADPSLVDFDREQIRHCEIRGDVLAYEGDERDPALAARAIRRDTPAADVPSGTRLTRDTWQQLYQPGEGFRLRGT